MALIKVKAIGKPKGAGSSSTTAAGGGTAAYRPVTVKEAAHPHGERQAPSLLAYAPRPIIPYYIHLPQTFLPPPCPHLKRKAYLCRQKDKVSFHSIMGTPANSCVKDCSLTDNFLTLQF